jgi:hypothetical protein
MTRTFDERRRAHRIQFEKPLGAKVMAIDGTWCRECQMVDVSESGAKIVLTDPEAVLTQFFLVLSAFGSPVFRRCKRSWVDGAAMGVAFQKGPISEKTVNELRREIAAA